MSEAFGLKSIASHPTDALPLGFKQRLALACSLMHEPDILSLMNQRPGLIPSPVVNFGCTLIAWWKKGSR